MLKLLVMMVGVSTADESTAPLRGVIICIEEQRDVDALLLSWGADDSSWVEGHQTCEPREHPVTFQRLFPHLSPYRCVEVPDVSREGGLGEYEILFFDGVERPLAFGRLVPIWFGQQLGEAPVFSGKRRFQTEFVVD